MPQTEILMGFKINYESKETLKSTIEQLAFRLSEASGYSVECVFLDEDLVCYACNNPSLLKPL